MSFRFSPCCHTRLAGIRGLLESFNYARELMHLAVWTNLSDPYHGIGQLFANDYALWTTAMASCNVICKSHCLDLCRYEIARHPNPSVGSLSEFWGWMFLSFDGPARELLDINRAARRR